MVGYEINHMIFLVIVSVLPAEEEQLVSSIIYLSGPATKRFVSNSPLGKKGCECKHCGKVLHNQGRVTSILIMAFLPQADLSSATDQASPAFQGSVDCTK